MAVDVVMPRLSDSMEEGTILQWLKSVGDEIKRGDELVEIETDKANMTYEATDEGVLIEIVAEEGDTLPIGEVIARIGAAGEEAAGRDGAARKAEPKQEPGPARAPAATVRREQRPSSVEPDGDGRVKASPIARRMARDLNVDLAGLHGSGPGGRIVKADVEAAAGEAPARAEAGPASAPAAPSPEGARGEVQGIELNRPQQTAARRM